MGFYVKKRFIIKYSDLIRAILFRAILSHTYIVVVATIIFNHGLAALVCCSFRQSDVGK